MNKKQNIVTTRTTAATTPSARAAYYSLASIENNFTYRVHGGCRANVKRSKNKRDLEENRRGGYWPRDDELEK